jgi:predicted DNA-binding protein
MTLSIELPASVESRLLTVAKRSGKSLTEFATEVLTTASEDGEASFDMILAPFRKEVAESGMSEVELDGLFQEALEEVNAERRK